MPLVVPAVVEPLAAVPLTTELTAGVPTTTELVVRVPATPDAPAAMVAEAAVATLAIVGAAAEAVLCTPAAADEPARAVAPVVIVLATDVPIPGATDAPALPLTAVSALATVGAAFVAALLTVGLVLLVLHAASKLRVSRPAAPKDANRRPLRACDTVCIQYSLFLDPMIETSGFRVQEMYRAEERKWLVALSPSLDRLLDPDEATAIIRAHTPLLPAEDAPLTDLAGRALLEDVLSGEDQPAFAASTVDGYAVVAGDTTPMRRSLGNQFAGRVEAFHVELGTAAYITTGAPVPPGANAVVMVERTAETPDGVRIDAIPNAGENIRPVGSDLRRGERVLAAGTALTPAAVGLLAALGRTTARVARRPRVSVLATGDELVEPGQPVRPGQIRDANRFALLAALAPLGVTIQYAGIAPDTDAAQRAFLVAQIADSDVVITSGGVSMGRKDLIKGLLVELATVHFRQLRMRPGKPFTFATAGPDGKTLLFGLPGNPVSGLVGFEVFVRPTLLAMQGHTRAAHARARVRLAHDVTPVDRIDYLRAKLTRGTDGVLEATANGAQQSSRLASLVDADALVIIPPRDAPYRAGELTDALLLSAV